MTKLVAVAVAAAAYVLGTKAGRARYEQIKTRAQGLWQDPRVQQKRSEAADLVKHKASGRSTDGDDGRRSPGLS